MRTARNGYRRGELLLVFAIGEAEPLGDGEQMRDSEVSLAVLR